MFFTKTRKIYNFIKNKVLQIRKAKLDYLPNIPGSLKQKNIKQTAIQVEPLQTNFLFDY